MQEAQSQEIFLEEDEPLIVMKMIDYLYCLDYNDHRNDETEESALMINARVYIIADKYDIEALKKWAVTKYQEVLSTRWNSASFIESTRLISENTPESDVMLRDVIVQKASQCAKRLFDRGEFVKLLRSDSNFATDVLKGVLFEELVPEEDSDMWGTSKLLKKKKNRLLYSN